MCRRAASSCRTAPRSAPWRARWCAPGPARCRRTASPARPPAWPRATRRAPHPAFPPTTPLELHPPEDAEQLLTLVPSQCCRFVLVNYSQHQIDPLSRCGQLLAASTPVAMSRVVVVLRCISAAGERRQGAVVQVLYFKWAGDSMETPEGTNYVVLHEQVCQMGEDLAIWVARATTLSRTGVGVGGGGGGGGGPPLGVRDTGAAFARRPRSCNVPQRDCTSAWLA